MTYYMVLKDGWLINESGKLYDLKAGELFTLKELQRMKVLPQTFRALFYKIDIPKNHTIKLYNSRYADEEFRGWIL